MTWISSRKTTFRLSEDTYLEPDVVIYPRASGIRGLGADNVLLVVEIGDSSLRYDTGKGGALCQFRHSRSLGHRRGSTDDACVPRAGGGRTSALPTNSRR
jgi:Putative restriction endonuclease